jgi:hypothetical protein
MADQFDLAQHQYDNQLPPEPDEIPMMVDGELVYGVRKPPPEPDPDRDRGEDES